MTDVKLTPEVTVTNKSLFLVRIDGTESMFVTTEADAKLAVDSIAASEVAKLEDESTKVFRRDQDDGKSVSISTQVLGYMVNGRVTTVMKIDFIAVPCARVIHGRHERKGGKKTYADAVRPDDE